MKKPTLLILAAGMASRYGSMKQVDEFGPNGETIIDYSIYDAIRAGFGKVVFVIKKEFIGSFQDKFEQKLQGLIETDYVFQGSNLKHFGIMDETVRSKPWGTAHAVLCARYNINEPFCVINADDFYGYDAFEKMARFLNTDVTDNRFGLIGFQINKTLSPYGSVTRGVCQEDGQHNMLEINERAEVYFKGGSVFYKENGKEVPLPDDTRVSMNFWGFTPSIFNTLLPMFKQFAKNNLDNPKAEFFIPLVAVGLIKTGKAAFKVIPSSSKWFGVTYKDDKPTVQHNIAQLIKDGVYPKKLWPSAKNVLTS
jgi:NDP-sugar pyrophosphorylase family protein